MTTNRRRFSRQIVDVPVYVSLGPDCAGLLYNLSEGGMALDIMGPAVGGGSIPVSFGLPEADQRIEVSSQLAWENESGSRAGLRFVDLPEASQQHIRDWLSGRAIAEEQPSQTLSLPEHVMPTPRESSLTPPWSAAPTSQVGTRIQEDVRASTDVGIPGGGLAAAEPAPRAASGLPGAERGSDLVTDVRSALFQAVQGREAARAPVTPQQLAHRQQRLRKLVVAVVSGALAGLVILFLAIFLREHSEQIMGDLAGLKSTVAGMFGSSEKVRPPVASISQSAVKSPLPRRAEPKRQTAASGAPRKAALAKPFQIEVVGPENRRYVASARGSSKIRAGFQGPSWKQGATPGAAGLESKPAAASAASSPAPAANTPATQQGRVLQEAAGEVPTQQVMPAYPLLALQKNVQGRVVLQATIGKDGSVQSVHLISGHTILATAVMDAVKQWRYKPVYRDGEPVEVQRRITVDFVISTD